MNAVGNVAGPLLVYEVLTAFFLEATMLWNHTFWLGAGEREGTHHGYLFGGGGQHGIGVLDTGA